MRTAQQRVAHYKARMQSSQIDPVINAIKTQAVANFSAYANEFVPRQEQLRGLMDNEGISPVLYFIYEAFNMEMYGIWNRMSGNSLTNEASILVAKYKAFGGDESFLVNVANTIWNAGIVPPGH
jgi:hypothetical protein